MSYLDLSQNSIQVSSLATCLRRDAMCGTEIPQAYSRALRCAVLRSRILEPTHPRVNAMCGPIRPALCGTEIEAPRASRRYPGTYHHT
eukprot:2647550-Rhodomonas_salina.1